jgi:hypothetical protein
MSVIYSTALVNTAGRVVLISARSVSSIRISALEVESRGGSLDYNRC